MSITNSGSTIAITNHDSRSIAMLLLHTLIRPFAPLLTKPGTPLPPGSPQLQAHSSAGNSCDIQELKVEDIYIYSMTAKTATTKNIYEHQSKKRRKIYYIAGGSFCQPPSPNHWKFCAELARNIPGATVCLISPPLAPHCPAPVTLPHLTRLYKALVADSADETVTFAGDSSGGNVILSMVMGALQETPKVRAPESILLISPVVDLRFNSPEIQQIEPKDPVLRRWVEVKTARQWAADWDEADPRLSPLFADIGILRKRAVKVHGVTGGYDILTPDTLLFRNKCEEVGIRGEWLHWEKQMHCFPIAFSYGLPESTRGKDWVVDVLRKGV